MEAMTLIQTLISNIGFPAAMCILCFMQMNKQSEQHKVETEKLAEALNNNSLVLANNTTVMQELAKKLDKE